MTVRYLSAGLWPLTSDGTNVTLESGTLLVPAGAKGTPFFGRSAAPATGWWYGVNAASWIFGDATEDFLQLRANSSKLALNSNGEFVWANSATNLDQNDSILDLGFARNAAGVAEINNGTAGTFRDLIVRTYRSRGANGQESQITTASALVSALSGASGTASNLIPAGVLLFGVTTRVTTLITGATSFDVGDEALEDKWGDGIAVAADTTTTLADVNVVTPTVYTVATDVILTARGGDFTAGAVRVTAHYMTLVAATS